MVRWGLIPNLFSANFLGWPTRVEGMKKISFSQVHAIFCSDQMASSPPKIPNCICHVKYQRHWRMPFLTWVALTKIGIKHFLSHCYLFIRPLSGHPSIRHQRDRLNSQMQLRTTFTTTWFALSRDLELFSFVLILIRLSSNYLLSSKMKSVVYPWITLM